MTNEGLFLKIDRVVQRECEGCHDCKPDIYAGIVAMNPCHGTGSVNVRVRGDVVVKTYFGKYGLYCPLWKSGEGCAYFLYKYFSDEDDALQAILTAYLSNTLPASLLQSDTNPDGLREVEI